MIITNLFSQIRCYFLLLIIYRLISGMKNILIVAAVLLSTILLVSEFRTESINNPETQYKLYLKKFGKSIPNDVQFLYRSKIFENFVAEMNRHNSDSNNKWKMGINQFSDLTKQEFVNTYLGEKEASINKEFKQQPINAGFAGEVDWRNRGIITPIKNQGKCGSCWAFAATAAHETYQIQFRNQPKDIVLSEQQLVDCSTDQPYGNGGCNGGYGVRALEYIKDFGQTINSSYPYMAVNQDCKVKTGNFRISGVSELTGCSEIDEAIHRRPMAVRVDASNWHLYASGIFDNCQTNLNHAVFLVGSSDEAWTIKNSWSAQWGESGFIRLKKGNTCGVCFGPSFPI